LLPTQAWEEGLGIREEEGGEKGGKVHAWINSETMSKRQSVLEENKIFIFEGKGGKGRSIFTIAKC